MLKGVQLAARKKTMAVKQVRQLKRYCNCVKKLDRDIVKKINKREKKGKKTKDRKKNKNIPQDVGEEKIRMSTTPKIVIIHVLVQYKAQHFFSQDALYIAIPDKSEMRKWYDTAALLFFALLFATFVVSFGFLCYSQL